MDSALLSEIVDVEDIDPATRQSMFAIYERYYEPAIPAVFEADLAAKSNAILLRDRSGTVRGFSTLKTWRAETPFGPHRFVYSGDTIIEKSCWGTQALPFRWIEHAGALKASDPKIPLIWFLITKGHRTYRYMAAFAYEYYPTWSRETPERVRVLMDEAGRSAFGAQYSPQAGIVRHTALSAALKEEFAGIDDKRRPNPEMSFFLQRNPGYAQGDELLCLCELSAENLRPIARAQFLRGHERNTLEPASRRRQA
jgi:hypothetical protein